MKKIPGCARMSMISLSSINQSTAGPIKIPASNSPMMMSLCISTPHPLCIYYLLFLQVFNQDEIETGRTTGTVPPALWQSPGKNQ
jgi:hypothetical protein